MQGDDNNKKPSGKKMSFSIYWMYAIIAVVLLGIYYAQGGSMGKEVSWTEFESYALNGGVKSIAVEGNSLEAELTDSLARAVFGKEMAAQKGAKAKVQTNIPSRDKLDEKVDQWRTQGKFKGSVEYVEE